MGKREVSSSTATLERPATVEMKPQAVAPPKQVEVNELAAQLGREEIAYAKAAETIFDRPQEEWTPGDHAILRRVGPRPGGSPSHDRNAFNRWLGEQTGRLRVVRAQQAVAGSVADRQAARQAADEAAAKLATEAPQIEAEMARLQARLGDLAGDAKQAQSVVERQAAAVVALQVEDRLPAWVRDELHAVQRRHVAEFKSELAQARGRLAGIAGVLAIDPESATGVREIELHVGGLREYGDSVARLRRFFTDAVYESAEAAGKPLPTFTCRKVKSSEWAAYCRTLAAEAESIKQRLEQLLPLEESAVSELERLRSHYVPE